MEKDINRSVSTRGLTTLLSLLSIVEAEAESKNVDNLDQNLYQTNFQEKTRIQSSRITEKPYFDTVDVVIGGLPEDTHRSDMANLYNCLKCTYHSFSVIYFKLQVK